MAGEVREEEKVRGLGLDDVVVLEGAEHTFPRTRLPDVIKILPNFWSEEGNVWLALTTHRVHGL